ncbi:MAG: sensor histidine kinase [Breznakibacter sp.]
MKLQSGSIAYHIVFVGIVLTLTGIFLQFTLARIYYKQIDDGIRTDREIIREEIEHLDTVPDYTTIFGHRVEVTLYQKAVVPVDGFSNVVLTDSVNTSESLYRRHVFASNRSNGLGYEICILKPLSELHKFKQVVTYVVILAFILLLAAFWVGGYFMNRRLWHPFYQTLGTLGQFNIDAPEALRFPYTRISEFKELNQILSSFSVKLKRDYIRMKEFSESLSHEINTKLAIITAKTELILQSENLSADQIEHFETIYQVTNNLIHLNNGLLLLAKIDNKFYDASEPVNLGPLIETNLQSFDDFIKQKEIGVKADLQDVELNMNKALCDILVSNCISNAVKHNPPNGYIHIDLKPAMLTVTTPFTAYRSAHDNRSLAGSFNSGSFFRSQGLGLEIIRRICRSYDFSFKLKTDDNQFCIEIGFAHLELPVVKKS